MVYRNCIRAGVPKVAFLCFCFYARKSWALYNFRSFVHEGLGFSVRFVGKILCELWYTVLSQFPGFRYVGSCRLLPSNRTTC